MKQILTIFLLCPLTMIAMEEKQLDTNDIYAGVITTILHASPHKGSTCVYPVARQTLIYKLPKDHTDTDIFEYVDAVEDWSEIHGQVKHIDTTPMNQITIYDLKFASQNTKIEFAYKFAEGRLYPTSFAKSSTQGLSLGQVVGITNTEACHPTSAFFKSGRFLPYSSICDSGTRLNVQEDTARNERLSKNPSNAVATTIAFLRLEMRHNGSQPVYIPSSCTNLRTILEKDHDE